MNNEFTVLTMLNQNTSPDASAKKRTMSSLTLNEVYNAGAR